MSDIIPKQKLDKLKKEILHKVLAEGSNSRLGKLISIPEKMNKLLPSLSNRAKQSFAVSASAAAANERTKRHLAENYESKINFLSRR